MNPHQRTIAGVVIDDELIRALLTEQAPEYSALDIGRYYLNVEEHLTVRLGDTHAIRFPRELADHELYVESLKWLRGVSAHWTFPHQLPLHLGEPSHGFPYPWEVVAWFDGTTALRSPLKADAAIGLALALREIHQPAPHDAPFHPDSSRGLIERTAHLENSLAKLARTDGPAGMNVDATKVLDIWSAATSAPVDVPRCWIHGRLDPRFVISDDGNFAGIIEWHYCAQGDPAIDLGYAGVLGGPEHIERFLSVYNPNLTDHTVTRARGVCVERAASYAGSDDPQLAALGWRRLRDLGVASIEV